MSLTVLSVAYPYAPVGPDAVGGAEQILSVLDRALTAAGHRSVVVGHPESYAEQTLIPGPRPSGYDDASRADYAAKFNEVVADAVQRTSPDLVHMQGLDFHRYLPPAGVPVLATLHLPIDLYPEQIFAPSRPDTWLHCVSQSQHAHCPPSSVLLGPIENGVAADDGPAPVKSNYALMLTRICPEKGVDLAIDAAKQADVPLIIGGQVFPYPDHERYFAQEIAPRLDGARRFIGPVGGEEKRALLRGARCLIVASRVAETSSLSAREAIAAGTPVVALRRGALPETVEHGRTGFLVDDRDAMADAMIRCAAIDPDMCRRVARERFGLPAMINAYFDLYRSLTRARGLKMPSRRSSAG